MAPPQRVKVRLRRTGDGPVEKLWTAVPEGAATVGCLVAAVARAAGVPKRRVVLSIDGFELPPGQPVGLVREGDVVHARVEAAPETPAVVSPPSASARKRRRDSADAVPAAPVTPVPAAGLLIADAASRTESVSESCRKRRRRGGGQQGAQPQRHHTPKGVLVGEGSTPLPPPPVLATPEEGRLPTEGKDGGTSQPPLAEGVNQQTVEKAEVGVEVEGAKAALLERLLGDGVPAPQVDAVSAQLWAQLPDAPVEGSDAEAKVEDADECEWSDAATDTPLTAADLRLGLVINYGLRELTGFDPATGGFRTVVRPYRRSLVTGVSGGMATVKTAAGEKDTVHFTAMVAPTYVNDGSAEAGSATPKDAPAPPLPPGPPPRRGVPGTITKWFPQKKYGFVQAEGVSGDVFVHVSKVVGFEGSARGAAVVPVAVGGAVEVWVTTNDKGSPVAEKARIVGGATPAPGDLPVREGGGVWWSGIVKAWLPEKNYGFVQAVDPATGVREDVFAHVKALGGAGDMLKVGFAVEVDMGTDREGRRRAQGVRGAGVGRSDVEALPKPAAPAADAPDGDGAGAAETAESDSESSSSSSSSSLSSPGTRPVLTVPIDAPAKRLPGVVREAARVFAPPAPPPPPPPTTSPPAHPCVPPRMAALPASEGGAVQARAGAKQAPRRKAGSVAGALALFKMHQQ